MLGYGSIEENRANRGGNRGETDEGIKILRGKLNEGWELTIRK